MAVDNSSIRLEELTHLGLCQPHGLSFLFDIQLGLAILVLIDNDFVVQIDLPHRFMGCRKPLVLKTFLFHAQVLCLLQIVHLFLSLYLRPQLFLGGKTSEVFRCEEMIIVMQNGKARDVIIGVGT